MDVIENVEEVNVEFSFQGIFDFLEEVDPDELKTITEGQLLKLTGENSIYIGCVIGYVRISKYPDDFIRIHNHPNYMNGELLSIKEFREVFSSLTGVDVSEDIDSKNIQIYITEGNKDNGVQHSIKPSPKEDNMSDAEKAKKEADEKLQAAIAAAVAKALADAGIQPKADTANTEQPAQPAPAPAAANDPMPLWKKTLIGSAAVATVVGGGYVAYRRFAGGGVV